LKTLPPVQVGDTVAIKTIIREGEKQRFQTFKGIIIGIKGSGLSKNFTVRKISFGVGVEKILPMHSPNIESIELLKKGSVRRAKLYYLRDRVGKRATKVKQGSMNQEEMEQYEELKNLGVVTESDEPEEIETAEVETLEETQNDENEKTSEKQEDTSDKKEEKNSST
jgi:large subunit ribosomal protein L19